MDTAHLWRFLLIGFPITVLIELPVLWWCLHPSHPRRRRLGVALWLTACSYPVVIVVLPILFQNQPNWLMITVAELFAPASECAVFLAAFGARYWQRDCAAIVAANLLSFGIGEGLHHIGFFEKIM